MKTRFNIATRAMRVASLPLIVLPMALSQAAPSSRERNSAIQRSDKFNDKSDLTALLFQSRHAEASASRLANPRRAVKSLCPPPKPRGVRLNVYSFFRVTNSDDGFKDDDVEVYGSVKLGSQTVWQVPRDKARTISNKPNPYGPGIGTTGPQRNEINTGRSSFEVIFDKPATWNLIVSGYLFDHDKGSSDDVLWNPYKMPHVVNIKDLAERFKARRGGGLTLAGDRKSESADLIVAIDTSEDIF